MVINISVQYNGRLLPDIILLTQGYYHCCCFLTLTDPLRIQPWSQDRRSGSLCITYVIRSILLLPCVMVYYVVSVLFLMFFWCPCMAINLNVQNNGGLLPDIILLTQCDFHREPV